MGAQDRCDVTKVFGVVVCVGDADIKHSNSLAAPESTDSYVPTEFWLHDCGGDAVVAVTNIWYLWFIVNSRRRQRHSTKLMELLCHFVISKGQESTFFAVVGMVNRESPLASVADEGEITRPEAIPET